MIINPKDNFINATRGLVNKTEISEEFFITGLTIAIHPEVFNPKIFFSSEWFAEEIAQLIKTEKVFIEVGCGTGIVSIKSAKENLDLRIFSTDINLYAVDMTNLNAQKNGVGDRITVFSGDVLDSIPIDVKADSIFWSMPFGYLDSKENIHGRDTQVFDPGYRAIRKFFITAEKFLKSNSRLLIGFSSDIGHFELLDAITRECGYSLSLITKTIGIEKDPVSIEIYEARKV